ncbi:isochorismate synthase [Lacicoccus alkaliphilus]|uniref:isochorismate synthase n=1 Tax=Lacicoccus alkaliphilus DSM 16010 TaxID=1123231 RepID=A0A1M7AD52_9BACL|nr:isochorismate synthase [Salinicoccus alkaliphilus]SHL40673.1 isochorismate synthase [Salinicoccus alkaliphilus DSM 16010]
MNLVEYEDLVEEVIIDSDSDYITLHIPIHEYDISHAQLFTYFKEYTGERYWFQSKDGEFDSIGIGYRKSITRDKFKVQSLTSEKNELYDSIQMVPLNDGLSSRLSLFGGVKFDDKDTNDEWSDFSMVEFHLPVYQFDLVRQEVFYTIPQHSQKLSDALEELSGVLSGLSQTEPDTYERAEVSIIKDIFPDEWKRLVDEAVDVLDEESFLKVVLARQRLITFKSGIDPLFLLDRLRDEKDTYTIYYEKGASAFVSKSPERLFEIEDNHLWTNAIAGSAPRTKDEEENAYQQDFLLHDEKNRYEHELVRQSIVEDLKPYSSVIEYDEVPEILKNKYIYHLHTPIKVSLNEDIEVFEILKAIHPTPAVGGLPKKIAQDYIKEQEYGTRGLYAAPIGLIHENNDSEFVVSLRSMLVSKTSATLFAGCGIVKGSSSEKEFLETDVKFTPMMNVLEVET